jgi:hypothetical protein
MLVVLLVDSRKYNVLDDDASVHATRAYPYSDTPYFNDPAHHHFMLA